VISREQVINRLRAADFHFKKKKKRIELYRQSGTGLRVDVPLTDLLSDKQVRIILGQARLTELQIHEFLKSATKG